MITFNNDCKEKPFLILREKYMEALKAKQSNIEAISVSSYSNNKKEVDSRYVNLKFINGKELIFFSNYNSKKSEDFKKHNQVSILFYWNAINTQIRIKACIKKTSKSFNNNYFLNRSLKKNALSISSSQSKKIKSFEDVQKKYKNAIENKDLKKCPTYWGGFSMIPYYFEFWEGHKSRINKRLIFELNDKIWDEYILEP